MPAATLRIMLARIISFWLMTSASAGTSRNVLMKEWLQRIVEKSGILHWQRRPEASGLRPEGTTALPRVFLGKLLRASGLQAPGLLFDGDANHPQIRSA